MQTQVAKEMRQVIGDSIIGLNTSKHAKKDAAVLLSKHFPDAFFQEILRCVQGELEDCKKINLQKWQHDAEADIKELAKAAKARHEANEARKKQEALEKITGIIDKKT